MPACLTFVSDGRYLPLTLIAAATAAAGSQSRLTIALLGIGISEKVSADVRQYLSDLGADPHIVDISENEHGLDWSSLSTMRSGISTATYGRLIAPEVLRDFDSILYLDGDVLIDGDIDELLRSPPAHFAAVEALHHAEIPPPLYVANPTIPRPPSYFNAGLCHINGDFWRRETYSKRALELLSTREIELPMSDQDVLNFLFGFSYQRLDLRWNFTWPMSQRLPALRPFIAHFAGQMKPWDDEEWRCPEVFKTTYQRYRESLPASVAQYYPSLCFDKQQKASLRRQSLLRAFRRDRGGQWNPKHAEVLRNWCGGGN
ncbi:MAG: glycosyltransferase [Pseudomonadota bacterium]